MKRLSERTNEENWRELAGKGRMYGKDLLPLIRSNGRGDRYSENIMKWVRKYQNRPMIAAFIGHCNLTGERLTYDPTKTLNRQIVLGYGEMDEGWISGRRLSEIIGGVYGVFSENYAYSPQFFPVELPEWWAGYIAGGKCFLDPEHRLYYDKERWEVSPDGKTRRCVWCGNHEQYLHSEMVERTDWRDIPEPSFIPAPVVSFDEEVPPNMVKENIPDILFDGYTVFQMVEYRGNLTNVSPENVAEVLDAIVACMRALPNMVEVEG